MEKQSDKHKFEERNNPEFSSFYLLKTRDLDPSPTIIIRRWLGINSVNNLRSLSFRKLWTH